MNGIDFQSEVARRARARSIAREILGVERGASTSELNRARRRLCLEHHPDRARAESGAEETFKLIQAAYRCLNGDEAPRVLLEAADADSDRPGQEGGDDNRWSYFLSWREQFF